MSARFRIGELASHAQCAAETIRYYEREGLLPVPRRSAGNYRLYGPEHLETLAFIRNCRSLDMTLEEIRQLLKVRELPQEHCTAAHALLDEHIAHVSSRIIELRQLQRQLRSLRQQCAPTQGEKDCAILDELGRATEGTARKPRAHVRGTHSGR